MIKICVISYNNEMATEPLSATFGPAGGSLGRGSDNSLILPDPKCHISRRQASIKSDGRRHSIMNLSQVSPILINGKKIALAVDAELQFGDEIEVGLYLLRAESPFGAAPQLESDARNGAFVSPFARDHLAPVSRDASQPQIDAMPLDLSHLTAEDSRHFADILGADASDDGKLAVASNDEGASLNPHTRPATAAMMEELDVPELNSIFAMTPMSEQQSPPSSLATNSLDAIALTQAFLRGAGLPLDSMPAGISAQWMEALGAFAAATTRNMIEQLADPLLEKHQIDPDSTNVLGANNPLKFLPSSRAALLQMFGASVPGFMSAAESIEDAGTSLRAHQIAVMAGMHAVLQSTLDRLDPNLVEQQIKAHPMLDSVMAANRKAKCWALYRELFHIVGAETNEGCKNGFGEPFVAAYERAIKQYAQQPGVAKSAKRGKSAKSA